MAGNKLKNLVFTCERTLLYSIFANSQNFFNAVTNSILKKEFIDF